MTIRRSAYSQGTPGTCSGMALLLCLIFLMALTLLGLSAASDTFLQNKLAANQQEDERARQSALLTLTWAENWLLSLDGDAPESCTEPCDSLHLHTTGDLPQKPESESISWWQDHGHVAGINPLTGERITTISADSINSPVWIIETLRNIPPTETGNPDLQVWYRLLARGSGRTETAVSVVESTVVRSWPDGPDAEPPDSETPFNCSVLDQPARCGRYSWRQLR